MIDGQRFNSPTGRALMSAVLTLRRYWLWGAVVVGCGIAFFGNPGGYTATSHTVLHGLCAQTPSHTLAFDGAALPFDSRMTGIYGGFLVTVFAIAVRGRMLNHGNPPRGVATGLGALVALMAVDGFNSLLTDLDVWHAYPPHNALRIVTGYGTGVALAVAVSWLLASSVWKLSSPRPTISSFRDCSAPAIGLVGFGLALLLRPAWLHFPLSMLLVISAWITVTMLVLVCVLLVFKLDVNIQSTQQLHVPVAMSALLAISVMLTLAAGRFWLERTLGITNAML